MNNKQQKQRIKQQVRIKLEIIGAGAVDSKCDISFLTKTNREFLEAISAQCDCHYPTLILS